MRPVDLPDRWSRRTIVLPNGCWLWVGRTDRDGYGVTKIGRRPTFAHRAIFEFFVGAIGHGLEIDHRCQNRCCVNPTHLDAVSHSENMRRAVALSSFGAFNPTGKKRPGDICANGHLLDAHNYVRDNRGFLACRSCTRDRSRRRALRSGRAA